MEGAKRETSASAPSEVKRKIPRNRRNCGEYAATTTVILTSMGPRRCAVSLRYGGAGRATRIARLAAPIERERRPAAARGKTSERSAAGGSRETIKR